MKLQVRAWLCAGLGALAALAVIPSTASAARLVDLDLGSVRVNVGQVLSPPQQDLGVRIDTSLLIVGIRGSATVRVYNQTVSRRTSPTTVTFYAGTLHFTGPPPAGCEYMEGPNRAVCQVPAMDPLTTALASRPTAFSTCALAAVNCPTKSYVFPVIPDAGGAQVLTASIPQSSGTAWVDTDSTDNTAKVVATVARLSENLSASFGWDGPISAEPLTVDQVGQTGLLGIVVRSGPNGSRSRPATIHLSPNLQLLGVPNGCSADGQRLDCVVPGLAGGPLGAHQFTFAVKAVAAGPAGATIQVATETADVVDPTPDDNTAVYQKIIDVP